MSGAVCGAAFIAALLLGTPLSARAEQGSGNGPGPGWTLLATHRAPVVAELHEENIVLLAEEPGDEGFVRGLVIFERPLETVMTLLTDYPRQNEYQADLVGFEVVAPLEEGGVIAEHRIRILFRNLEYRVMHRHDHETQRIYWSLDPNFDNDLVAMDGYWELHRLDPERTLGVFGTRVDPGGAVPKGFARRVSRLKVPENMEKMRVWVNREGGDR